jgi:hypothetical protein
LIALDTECCGLDFHHGARPFFVTIAREDQTNRFWEWNVNPLTRIPFIPPGDLDEIRAELVANVAVLQNRKFDTHALYSIGVTLPPGPCTLTAGHLLASNLPHDLTAMAIQYLGVDIKPFEAALETAVRKARKIAKAEFGGKVTGNLAPGGKVVSVPRWRIAEAGDPMMPSAGGKSEKKRSKGAEDGAIWRADMWLPRAVAKALEYPKEHTFWSVLQDYSNADSATTLALWLDMEPELRRRGL